MTKNQYVFAVYLLLNLLNSSKSISDELLMTICWSYCLFEIFTIKKCIVFSLTSSGIWKYDCVINTKEIIYFLLLINSPVTTGWVCINILAKYGDPENNRKPEKLEPRRSAPLHNLRLYSPFSRSWPHMDPDICSLKIYPVVW